MTKEQISDYKRLCQERAKGRLLTAEALLLVCEAYHYDPENIGKHFIEVAHKIKLEKHL